VGFVGYGQFGRALGALAAAVGMDVRAYDVHAAVPDEIRAPSLERLAAEVEFIVVAVPVERIRSVLEGLKPYGGPQHVVLDVGSVKIAPMAAMREVLGGLTPWVGTHPLFGPTSLALGEQPLTVLVCPSPVHPGAAGRARALFEELGCRVVEQDADAHDRLMASTHALAYFVAKAMLDTGVESDTQIGPPSFKGVLRTIEAVRSDATHLFTAIHVLNPYAAAARRRLLAALTAVDRDLLSMEAADGEEMVAPESLTIPDLGAQSPALRETRELIDDVDRGIVALLVRRAQLARGAADVKAGLGRGVLDPVREVECLDARRAWAVEQGLEPESVGEVFEAVLRFSRRVQESTTRRKPGDPTR
jgi:prephenate dehydrogenase